MMVFKLLKFSLQVVLCENSTCVRLLNKVMVMIQLTGAWSLFLFCQPHLLFLFCSVAEMSFFLFFFPSMVNLYLLYIFMRWYSGWNISQSQYRKKYLWVLAPNLRNPQLNPFLRHILVEAQLNYFTWIFARIWFCLLIFPGEKGESPKTGKPLHYKGTFFHCIFKGSMAKVCASFTSFGFWRSSSFFALVFKLKGHRMVGLLVSYLCLCCRRQVWWSRLLF